MCYTGGMKRMWIAAAAAVLLLAGCSVEKPVLAPDAPVAKLPAAMCYMDTVVPHLRTDLKYAGSDNFVGRPVRGYTGRRAILGRETAGLVAKAARILAAQGYGILVWDAYRPTGAMQDFFEWSKTPDERTKPQFYPNLTKRQIYAGRYIGTLSEHSMGIAVDVTLYRLKDGREVDMGGRHDLLDASSALDSPLVTAQQRANRRILHDAMVAAGMKGYDKEWWHYFKPGEGPFFLYGFPLNDNLAQ